MREEEKSVSDVEWADIYGLYSEGWGERLVPEAMAHPAKVRPAVARAIFDFAIKQGWWHKGGPVIVTEEVRKEIQDVVTSSGYVLSVGPDGKPILPDVGESVYRQPSVIADPFGGVGGFLLTGGWAGLRMVGVELEQRFVDLCNANLDLHAGGWDAEHPRPTIIACNRLAAGRAQIV